MPTVFESISDGFYTAFFEPEPDKRKEKIESWIKESTPVIQSAVENDLRSYLEGILEKTWEQKGWESRAEKFMGKASGLPRQQETPFIDAYKLHLDIKIRPHNSKDQDIVFGALTPEIRAKTNEAAEAAKTAIAKLEPPRPVVLKEIDIHGNIVQEAIPIVDKFLKDCYRDNVRRVRIIHGKGIFVLQKAIRGYLGEHELIKPGEISAADKDHGGEGATEANLIDFSVEKLD